MSLNAERVHEDISRFVAAAVVHVPLVRNYDQLIKDSAMLCRWCRDDDFSRGIGEKCCAIDFNEGRCAYQGI